MPLEPQPLSGRVAIVTGGSRGIGLGISRSLATAGATVAIVGRSPAALEAARSSLTGLPGPVHTFAGDVSTPDGCKDVISTTHSALGPVDIICANAGIFPSAPLPEMTPDRLEEIFSVNVFSTFHLLRAAWADLTASGQGRVVLTSSITGPQTGYPGWAHYGATKAAQLGLMRTAALELAPFGVTVNAVLPGNVATEGLADMGQQYTDAMAASVPLGRLGTVDEIGATVSFLCGPGASFITGQAIVVDGGQTLPECADAILPLACGQESA